MISKPSIPKQTELLIAGLGNNLLMDDGVGIHALRALQEEPLEGACMVEIGTAVLDAIHLFETAKRVIALDAVQAGSPPGTVYELSLDAVRSKGARYSMHEMGLREVFRLMPEQNRPELVILGVEPHTIDYGTDLSPAIQSSLPKYLKTIRSVVERLLE
ncbi:MAG: hydrogenase maturation protease [Planctomycetota bacterium]